jgi:ADP-ribose pyrophosphatase YjhB (NUDIX family)
MDVWFLMRRPQVRGVACVLRDGRGRVLLMRQTYGDRRRWWLPGGFVGRSEEPVAAAARECAEELGVEVVAWRPLGAVPGTWQGKRETLFVFAGDWPGGAARCDPVEVLEARWFDLNALPPLGAPTAAAIQQAVRPHA